MRQHHSASLPFFFPLPACINGANRNYQILCFSLKPSYGNHYLTMLYQAKEMTSASLSGFAGGCKCKALPQGLCRELSPVTWQCSIVRWLSRSRAQGKHAYPSTPRRPQAKSCFAWGCIITLAGHTPWSQLLHRLLAISQAPRRGQRRVFDQFNKSLGGRFQFELAQSSEDVSNHWPTLCKQDKPARQSAKISLQGKWDRMKFWVDLGIHLTRRVWDSEALKCNLLQLQAD